jgi:hypothetical protein
MIWIDETLNVKAADLGEPSYDLVENFPPRSVILVHGSTSEKSPLEGRSLRRGKDEGDGMGEERYRDIANDSGARARRTGGYVGCHVPCRERGGVGGKQRRELVDA